MDTFGPRDLLECYARGVFPMADAREDESVFLVDPEKRGVIPLDGFHVSRRLARTVRGNPFDIRFDTAFPQVVLECAESKPGRTETWINGAIEDLYAQLFEIGHAHSVECFSFLKFCRPGRGYCGFFAFQDRISLRFVALGQLRFGIGGFF